MKQRLVRFSLIFIALSGVYLFVNRVFVHYFSTNVAIDVEDYNSIYNQLTTESSKILDSKSKVLVCDVNTDLNCDSTMSNVTPPDLSQFSYSLFALLASSHTHQAEDVELRKIDKNILVSPFSIASALALVLSGTTKDSSCEAEFQTTLSVTSHKDLPLLSQTVLQSSSGNVKNGVQFTSANGIWVKESVKSEFVQTAKNLHSAIASSLPETFDSIDKFISQETNGHISNMLEGPIDPLTQAILVNAVYFKGSWKEQFDPIHTTEGLFHSNIESGENENFSRRAKFMFASRQMNVGQKLDELAGATMVLLDYENNVTGRNTKQKFQRNQNDDKHEFSALFILPPENNEKSMEDVIQSLLSLTKKSSTSLGKIIEQKLHYRKIDLKLPRFKISWGVESLKSYLKQLGIKSAFEDNSKEAMFSKISDDPSLHLDDVYHKSVMEVSEEGTEAAAATVAIMKARSMPMPSPQITFDRPFIMIVLHVPTMTPLFITKINHLDNSF